jgi:gliding motility-associated-like protein
VKNISKYILSITVLAVLGLFTKNTEAQCLLNATIYPNQICAGDAVSIAAIGGCGYLMKNDFNNQQLGTGWSSTAANPVFTNPCGPGPSGAHAWVGTTASQQRTLVTIPYDVSIGGCSIEWDMRYGLVPGSGPCEDPDAASEGVHLQYAINAPSYTAWTDFPGPNLAPVGPNSTSAPFVTNTPGSGGYWQPLSSASAQNNSTLYHWHRYACSVPTIAATTATKFRWAQLATSNTGFDAWGIDEVEIVCPTGNLNILWSTGDTVFNPPAQYPPQHPNNIPYDTCYIVHIWDSINPLGAYDTVCVRVNPIPTSDFTVSDTAICMGDSVVLTYTGTATSSATFGWNIDGNSKPGMGPFTEVLAPAGLHSISLSVGEHGCNSTPTMKTVNVHANPLVSFSANPLKGCNPLTVNFTDGSMPDITAWNWNFGDGNNSNSQNPSHTYTASGLYTVSLEATTKHGCKNDIIIPNLVTVDKMPKASFSADPPVTNIDNPTIKFTDLSQDAAFWDWTFGDGNTSTVQNPEHTFDEGIYNVCLTVTTTEGCKDSICHEVMVIVDKLTIPNIITPNGDGYNDVFVIENIDKVETSELIIFNRWGKKVFETTNYRNDWDGENVADGVYFYVLRYKTYFSEEERNGSVTVMRK